MVKIKMEVRKPQRLAIFTMRADAPMQVTMKQVTPSGATCAESAGVEITWKVIVIFYRQVSHDYR
jgi:hypothetical protein